MKKTISRAFSLFLVLAILVGVMPAVLADNVLTVTGDTVVVGGSSITLTATPSTDVNLDGFTWSWQKTGGNGEVTLSVNTTSTCTVSGKTAGSVTLTVTATKAATEPEGQPTTYTGTHTVTVEAVEAAGVTIDQGESASVAYGSEPQLTATVAPADSTDQVTWSVGPNDYIDVSASGKVSVKKAGGENITVTATAGTQHDTIKISTTKKDITASIKLTKSDLQPTETATATVELSGKVGSDDVSFTVSEWATKNDKVVTVKDGTVTAVATGTTQITAKGSLTGAAAANYNLTNGTTAEGVTTLTSADIKVANGSMTLDKTTASLMSGSKETAVFEVKDVVTPADDTQYTLTYTKSSKGDNADVTVAIGNDNKVTISAPKGVGEVAVTIIAKSGETIIAQKTIYIGVYDEVDITGTLLSNVSKFDADERVFASLYKGKTKCYTLADALKGVEGMSLVKFGSDGSPYFHFSPTSVNISMLSSLEITVQAAGTKTISYDIYSANDVLIRKGVMKLTANNADGDIVYTGSYGDKVIFDASDFSDFWSDKKSDGVVSGSLGYVKFEDLRDYTDYLNYGTLWRNTACSDTLLTSDKYTTSSRTGYYLLDNVTYKIKSTVTSPVSVRIPFTAYGATSGQSVKGVVEIRINQESTGIYATGIKFGSGSSSVDSLAEQIADTYYANTGKTLSYVTFPNLSASTGKLFYDYDGILSSKRVSSTYKFYADPTGSQLDLDDVMFVPRAGLYDEVTINYKAYDVSGTTEYSGTLVLNVVQKTKSSQFSDVKANSYKWAADSVDFLYVEEVANGTSSSKYSPASSIKRGDFMLMLYRAFLEEDYDDYNVTTNFSDMTKGTTDYTKETYQAVGVAKALGIAQGTGGKFNPNNYITRQEAMALIYRTITLDEVDYDLNYSVSTDTSDFKDHSSVASYAKTAISYLIEHGIVIGSNDKINPKSNINRAEMAVILHRVLTY